MNYIIEHSFKSNEDEIIKNNFNIILAKLIYAYEFLNSHELNDLFICDVI